MRRRILQTTGAALLLMAVIVGLLPAKTAFAGPTTGEWLNRHQIKAGDSLYVDVGPYDDNENYKKDGGTAECPVIKDFDGSGPNATFVEKDSFGDCKKTNGITLTQTGNYDIVGYRIDADKILALPYNPYEPGKRIAFLLFRRPPADERPNDSTYYLVDGGNLNRSVLLRTSPSLKVCMEAIGFPGGGGGGGEDVVGDGRKYICFNDGKLWNNGTVAPASVLESIGEDPSNPGANANNDDSNEVNENSCEAKSGAMGWLICPVILITDSALNWVDTQINSLLRVDQAQYTDDRIEGAWRNIRNIAYIILVPIMLVMVIGTALGFQFLDAYTVKRALPRLFAAVIFISVSYPICVFLIELFNSIGSGVIGLLTSPFGDAVSTLSLADLFDGNIFSSIFTVPGLVIGVALMIWLFGGTLLLFAAIAFLVLLIRQIFIIALVLVAPLAILAWIFPGNDRLWKSWWSIFSKLLMMYPLILAIIAIGRIFALIINFGGAGQPDVLNPLMKLAAYMLPYAFIPFTFKFAGGVFATITGVVNDRSKGLFDRRRQSRQQKLERTANQNMFRNAPPGGLRSQLNTAGAAVMHARRAGLNPFRWRAGISGALTDNSILQREAMLEDKENTWQNDDGLNRAALESVLSGRSIEDILRETGSYANTPEGERELRKDARRITNTRKKYGESAFAQATWMRAMAGGTAFRGADAYQAAARIEGGNRAVLTDLIGKGKGLAMNAGRVDQGGAGFGDLMTIARRTREGWTDENGQHYTGEEYFASGLAQQHLNQAVIRAQGPTILLHPSTKQQAIENLTPELLRSLGDAFASGDVNRVIDNLAQQAGLYENMNATNPQKAEYLRDHLMSQQIDLDDLSPALQQLLAPGAREFMVAGSDGTTRRRRITLAKAIETVRHTDRFALSRREFQTMAERYEAQARQGQRPPGPGEGIPTPPLTPQGF